jgi:hypothetical protein
MIEVVSSGEWYIVRLNGEDLGMFAYMLDANCFALQLLERGMATSVMLVSGLTICA